MRDISERKEAERLLLQARNDAGNANNAKTEFLARMSHEFRTPLNAILGFDQLLQMEGGSRSKEQSEEIEHIMIAGRHLLQLVNEVLDIAKIDANEMEFSIEDVGLGQIIENSLALIKPLADEHGMTIEKDDVNAVCVRADSLRLKQVMLNLLSNAVINPASK